MKLVLLALTLLAGSAEAAVRFEGGGWGYGGTEKLILKDLGIGGDENGLEQVVLNFEDFRQVILSGPHAAIGLSLTNYVGKCIKVIPGKKFASVDILLNCQF